MTFGKKTYKRAIATLLTVVMVMAMLPVSVLAAGETAIAHVVKMTAAPNNMVRFELKALSDESLTSGAKPLVTEYAKGEVVAIVFKSTDGAEKYVDYGTTQNNYITSRTTGASAAVAAAAAAATTTPATAFAAGGQVVYPATATGLPDTTAGVTVTGTTPTKAELTGVAITGSTAVGSTLTASLTPASATATYEWFAVDTMVMTGGTKIAGETKSTLELKAAQKDKFVYVVATPIAATTTGTAKMAVTATKVTDVVTKVAIKTVTVKDASTIDLEFESAVAGLVKGDVMVTKGTETLEVDTISAGTGALYSLKLKTAMTTSGEVTVAGTATSDKVTTAAKSGMFTVTPAGAVTVSDITATTSKVMKVTFSGAVKAGLASNFSVKEKVSGTTLPIEKVELSSDKLSMNITFYDTLVNGKTYTVVVDGVKDSSDAAVATYTKDVEFTRGEPATIELKGTKLPKAASVDLKDFVVVKDASGNVLDTGFTITFETSPAASESIINTSSVTSVTVKATVTGTAITTGIKILAVEASKVASISTVMIKKGGTEVTSLYANGNASTSAGTLITTGDIMISVTTLDQFGNSHVPIAGEVVYTSNNSAVASVTTAGKITPIGKGSVTITATAGAVVKTLTVDVKESPKATDLEVPATIAVAGVSTAPRMPIKIVAKDQYGTKVNVTDLKFTSATSDVATLFSTATAGSAIPSGATNLTVAAGEQMYYVQGLKGGTAEFVFELTVGTAKVTKKLAVTSTTAGAAAGYEVVTEKDTININTANDYANIVVYRTDAAGLRVSNVTSTVTMETTSDLILAGSSAGYFKNNTGNTTAGTATVTVKDGTLVVGTATIKVVKSTATITSVTLDKPKVVLNKTTDLLGYDYNKLVNNLVITMSDGKTYGSTASGADLTAKKQLISEVLSSNDEIVAVDGTTVMASAAAPALPVAGNIKITKGTTDIVVKFADDAFDATTFQVEVADVSVFGTNGLTVNTAGTASNEVILALEVAEGATLIIPTGNKLVLTGNEQVALNGTIQNNGDIIVAASTAKIVADATEGKKGILSGTGYISGSADSAVLGISGNLEIPSTASQTIKAFGSDASESSRSITVKLDGGVLTNSGNVNVLGSKKTPAEIATFANGGTNDGTVNNYGTFKLTGGGYAAGNAVFTNGASGDGIFNNYGTLDILGSKDADAEATFTNVTAVGFINNDGTINVTVNNAGAAHATLDLQDVVPTAGAFINNGTLNIGAPTTAGVASVKIADGGTIENKGTINNNGSIVPAADMTIVGPTAPGTFAKLSGGTATKPGKIAEAVTGIITVTGNLELQAGAHQSLVGIGTGTTLLIDPASVSDGMFKIAGTLILDGTTDIASLEVETDGSVTVLSTGDIIGTGSLGVSVDEDKEFVNIVASYDGTWDSSAKKLTINNAGESFIIAEEMNDGIVKLNKGELLFMVEATTVAPSTTTDPTTGATIAIASGVVTLTAGDDAAGEATFVTTTKVYLITVTKDSASTISSIEVAAVPA